MDTVTVVLFVVGIVVMLVGLAVSIALHELGHLIPAKLFGVRVGQYMIGFGPRIWSRRIGETEYGFKWLPLGGYISMAGMYPLSTSEGKAGGGFFAAMVQDARVANDETVQGGDDQRVFYRLPVYKRVIVMLGGPVMNLLLAIVLFTIVFSGIGMPTATTSIASVSQCVLPAGSTATSCGATDPVAPAAAAGLKPGDQIVSIDGAPVSTFDEASAIIRRSPGRSLDLLVRRDGADIRIQLTPMLAQRPVYDAAGKPVQNADGTPTTEDVGFAGILPQSALVPQPLWAGPQAALQNVGAVAGIIVQLPVKVYDTAVSLFTGGTRDPNGPLSVVGVGVIAGEVASSDVPLLNRVSATLGLLGSLNIALFVFNLVPLLPLDGGHVAVALWDGLRRAWSKLRRRPPPKPVDATKLVPVTFVVVVLLIAMSAVLILADLINPISLVGP